MFYTSSAFMIFNKDNTKHLLLLPNYYTVEKRTQNFLKQFEIYVPKEIKNSLKKIKYLGLRFKLIFNYLNNCL